MVAVAAGLSAVAALGSAAPVDPSPQAATPTERSAATTLPTDDPAVPSSLAPSPVPATPASGASPATATRARTASTVRPEPVTSTTSAPPSTRTATPSVPATTDPPPPSTPDARGASPVRADGSSDDPSFELGPVVVLDVGDARFPADDAGVGAAPSVEPDAADDALDDSPGAAAADGWSALDRSLRAELIRPGNTAASVAVSIDGEIVHRAAFGDRDPATADPADAGDRFRIASISKPIAAIVALRLVEDGVVGLDEPIGDLIAAHVGAPRVPAASSAVTLRGLLGHRSGFGRDDGLFFRRGARDCADAARRGLVRGPRTGGYAYSNMNYCLVGMAIEALTATSYERAAYRHLLTPLGISGMRLAPTFDPGPDEVQHAITPGRNYMETLGAAGAWVATPSDLVTILDSLDHGSPGFHPLSPETVAALTTAPGRAPGARGYGLGVISYGGGRLGHTGTIESTHAMVLDRGDGVTWAITVAGRHPGESTDLERVMNEAFAAGGFVAG